jgi:hypothetical protein
MRKPEKELAAAMAASIQDKLKESVSLAEKLEKTVKKMAKKLAKKIIKINVKKDAEPVKKEQSQFPEVEEKKTKTKHKKSADVTE